MGLGGLGFVTRTGHRVKMGCCLPRPSNPAMAGNVWRCHDAPAREVGRLARWWPRGCVKTTQLQASRRKSVWTLFEYVSDCFFVLKGPLVNVRKPDCSALYSLLLEKTLISPLFLHLFRTPPPKKTLRNTFIVIFSLYLTLKQSENPNSPIRIEVGEGGGVFETQIQTNKKASVAAQPILRGECNVNNLSCEGSDT